MRPKFWLWVTVILLASACWLAWNSHHAVAAILLMWAAESWYCSFLERTLLFVNGEIEWEIRKLQKAIDGIEATQNKRASELLKRELETQLHHRPDSGVLQ